MASTIRILLVDDHQIVIDGLRALLADEGRYEVVGQANNGKEALLAARILKPELVLMDLDMPEMNGIVATAAMREQFPDIKIIVLSLHYERSIVQKIMQNGAKGYLVKNADKEELLRAIDLVADGELCFADDVLEALHGKPRSQLFEQGGGDSALLSQLTERELEIIKAIAQGLSNKEIAAQMYISHRTVDTHRTNIMKKLGVNKVVGLIKFAIRNGLVEED